jgi:hypothetical protein
VNIGRVIGNMARALGLRRVVGGRQERSADEQEALDFLYSLSREGYRVQPSRTPTDEEVMVAAWANLAVEERDLTLDDARRLLAAR